MNFDYEKYIAFSNRYIYERNNLSNITVQMIDTMFSFINRDKVKTNRIKTKKAELLGYKYSVLGTVIAHYNNETLLDEFELLRYQVDNNENYLPLFIKLQCCVGIYPDDFLIGYAKQIFDNEIYNPIMGGYYKDNYADDCLTFEEQNKEKEQKSYQIKIAKPKAS